MSFADIWQPYLHEHIHLFRKSTQALLICCRRYAMHYDTYLNAACRQKIYPLSQLQTHAQSSDADVLRYLFTGPYFHVQTRTRIHNLMFRLPFHLHRSETLAAYISHLAREIRMMYRVFSKHHWTLSQPMTVFRCLRLRQGQIPDWRFLGFTSTSYVLTSALQFIVHGREAFDVRKDECYILQVTLPPGTRFIPMSLLTVQEEHEILILSQGTLTVEGQVDEAQHFWNPLRNSPDNNIHYHRVLCTLQITQDLPVWYDFQLAEANTTN